MFIFFMDTEGSGAVAAGKTEEYDIHVFTLALLMSSYFIYNVTGVINEPMISKLSLVTKLAQSIQTNQKSE